MKLSVLNEWLSLLANLGVVAGIVFLAVEIRQNTNMMQAQVAQSRSETAISLNEPDYSSEYLSKIKVKLSDGETLTPAETTSYLGWIRAYLRVQENLFQQYQFGLIDEYVLRGMTSGIVYNLSRGDTRLGLDFWDSTKTAFSDEFVEFVDREIISKAQL